MQKQAKPDLFLPISIILSGLIVSGAILYTIGNNNAPQSNSTTQTGPDFSQNAMIDDDVILGDPSATVTITLFGDYQCPFCKDLFDGYEEQLRKEYVDTGRVNMVYRDFPLDHVHPYARRAAMAAQCAADQGKFWEYHDELFRRQTQIGTMDFTRTAKDLGLNDIQFQSCLQTEKYKDEVEKDFQYGIEVGVRATPTTFIGETKFEGVPRTYQEFKNEIERLLSQQ